MDAFEMVRRKLQKYPSVRFEQTADSIRIFPPEPNGFAAALYRVENTFTVHFEGWHEEFTDAEEALDCLAFGLSDDCRLKVESRGGVAYRWTAEYRTDDGWVEESTTGLVFCPFWRRREVRFLQNSLIKQE